ncbi:MAG TPA: DUF6088 family protein [Candidatus Sulfotelmatobacter sp.]|nr:DUF6088 family protein [Candidatus Sulfotelmatobacter sp.]
MAEVRAKLPQATNAAIEQAFARLAKDGTLLRISKGVYWKARRTRFGMVRPDAFETAFAIAGDHAPGPAGPAAAAFLGLTTQIPPVQDYAVLVKPAVSLPNVAFHERTNTRRKELNPAEIAVLEIARDRCRFCELPQRRIFAHLRELAEQGKISVPAVREAAIGETRMVQEFVTSLS